MTMMMMMMFQPYRPSTIYLTLLIDGARNPKSLKLLCMGTIVLNGIDHAILPIALSDEIECRRVQLHFSKYPHILQCFVNKLLKQLKSNNFSLFDCYLIVRDHCVSIRGDRNQLTQMVQLEQELLQLYPHYEIQIISVFIPLHSFNV